MSEPEDKSGSGFGFTETIVLACIILFVALVIIPNRIDSRKGPGVYSNACINNMRQIEGAKNEWALVNGKTNGAVVTENDIKNYIKLNSKGNVPPCPSGGKYNFGKVGVPVTCSLSNAVPPHVWSP